MRALRHGETHRPSACPGTTDGWVLSCPWPQRSVTASSTSPAGRRPPGALHGGLLPRADRRAAARAGDRADALEAAVPEHRRVVPLKAADQVLRRTHSAHKRPGNPVISRTTEGCFKVSDQLRRGRPHPRGYRGDRWVPRQRRAVLLRARPRPRLRSAPGHRERQRPRRQWIPCRRYERVERNMGARITTVKQIGFARPYATCHGRFPATGGVRPNRILVMDPREGAIAPFRGGYPELRHRGDPRERHAASRTVRD